MKRVLVLYVITVVLIVTELAGAQNKRPDKNLAAWAVIGVTSDTRPSQNFIGTESGRKLIAAPYSPINKAGEAMTGALTTEIAHTKIGDPSIDPNETVQEACGDSASHSVYLPVGNYTTTGIQLTCSNLTITCAATGFAAQGGVRIQLSSTATPVHGVLATVFNPTATTAKSLNSIEIQNCSFDRSMAPGSTANWDLSGVSHSIFINDALYSNGTINTNTTGADLVINASNFSVQQGSYYNEFYGVNGVDASTTSTAMGVYLTGDDVSGANSNRFFGGGFFRYGTAMKVDDANDIEIYGTSFEGWRDHGVWVTTKTVNGTTKAGQVKLYNSRFENLATAGTAIQMDQGVSNSLVVSPYVSGFYTYYIDNNSIPMNTCIDCTFGNGSAAPSTAVQGSVFGHNVPTAIGMNTMPRTGVFNGTLDIGNGNFYSTGTYNGATFGDSNASVTQVIGQQIFFRNAVNTGNLAYVDTKGFLHMGLNNGGTGSAHWYFNSSANLPTSNRQIWLQDAVGLAAIVGTAAPAAGQVVQYVDTAGSQHMTSAPTISATPTVGRATCWKTATQIGYCSTQPDATGACTCN
jgi:hypothetical protein